MFSRSRDEHRFGFQNDGAKNLKPLGFQCPPGGNHIGDCVSDAKLDCRFDRAIESDNIGGHPVAGEKFGHKCWIARRHGLSGEVRQVFDCLWGRETKRGVAKIEGVEFAGGSFRVEQQIPSGDSHIERPRADIRRDISWAQVVELHAVALIGNNQRTGVAAPDISGFDEHVDGSVRERALIGHRNLQGARAHSASYTSSSPTFLASINT